ncbi:hypothetical protein CAEBREN_31871 [Caenorhabditis brenneri]|uniref:Uncharacterized protein n=1 Tax=Caenorhabditis brenneri TaxID=135651 RepID=G0NYJ4_CAEBE|nr:hypothetical protein CAEBREN_31871 [Caenorhabditis brenneri]
MSINAVDSKKLVEALLGDLRLLSQEAKKKQNHVKEAAETGVVRIRNISTASVGDTVLITNLRAACTELLHPLVLACETRHTRLVQIALQGIQRLVQHRILSGVNKMNRLSKKNLLFQNGATIVTNELWALVEAECEELRVLQTVPPLVSSELVVTGNTLAKCIVMCFRLHFAKDPIVINAASAAVRQLVSTVFERVIQEDGIFSSELTVVNPSGGRPSPRAAPPTLRPCAADAYMLFKDLCLLINGEAPIWLVGIQEMTRTLGLELLESLLKGYPSVFIRVSVLKSIPTKKKYFQHTEFADLLKDDVCPLIIRLFSPNVKAMHISSQHPSSRTSNASISHYPPTISHERQSFPISMRLVRIVTLIVQFYQNILHTECEIFISTLLKFVDGDRKGWQRPLALESLHRIVASPELVKWMTESFDCRPNSTHVLEQVATGLSTVVQQCLVCTTFSSGKNSKTDIVFNKVFRPRKRIGTKSGRWWTRVSYKRIMGTIHSLDRMDAVAIPDGYVISRCCVALCDLAQSVYMSIDKLCNPDENESGSSEARLEIAKIAYANSQPSILAAIGSLLAASTDEMVSDHLFVCLTTLIRAGCRVGADADLHRSVYVLAIMSLPSPSYLTQFAGISPPSPVSKREVPISEQVFDLEAWPSTAQVTATGPPCPCPVVSTELWNKQVLLTSKNLKAAQSFIGSVTSHMEELKDLWYLCMATCEHLSWLLAMRPTQIGQFERETRDDHSNGPTVVTNAALKDIGILSSTMDKVAPAIAALPDESFLSVIDALIRLSDESLAVAATGRESSLFPLAVLYRVCSLSLTRIDVFWAKTANHFIKVCNHTSVSMRDWAAVALTSLAKHAIKSKTSMDSNGSESTIDVVAPELPQAQWVESWKVWLRISRGLARQGCAAMASSVNAETKSTSSTPRMNSSTSSLASLAPGVYVPGPSHLTAILHIFPPLFDKVAKSITIDDLKYESLPAVLESMMNVPIPSEQAPFVLPSSSTHLTPTQEALLEAVKIVFVECTISGTSLRSAIPDQIRLLLKFASMATQRISPNKVAPGGQKSYRDYALTTIVPFSEYSLRIAIEFFTSTSQYPDVANSLIAIDIIKFLGEPLYMKYTCISPTTWKLAASSLMSVLRTSIPYARQNPEVFRSLWSTICDTMERWLFTPNKSTRLAADERKRDELMECQAVEIIRSEMLAYASRLPQEDVQRLISLLHRGSISQIDSTDVLASDSHTQRNELAKACFDALLMSTDGAQADPEEEEGRGILGNVAVTSLLQRCTQVMSDFCKDWSAAGDLRLPRSRILEIISALQAVDSLIARLARDPRMTDLYSQLISLFPAVVDVMPCCHADAQLEQQLIKTIKSYQTLFLLQNIPQV